jgi:hypothetical protein
MPPRTPMEGRFCRLVPLDPVKHARELFEANSLDRDGRNWTYLFVGPFADFENYSAWLEQVAKNDDPLFHTIVDKESGKAVGVATFMRIDRAHGVIEVGNINYSPLLQRKPAATEAMFLMMGAHSTSSAIAATSGNATASTARRGQRRCGSGSPTKACSGRRPSTKVAAVIRRGSPSLIANGRRCAAPTSSGWRPRTSTRKGTRNAS